MKKFVLKRDAPNMRPEDYIIKYDDLLNKQQLEAVYHEYGASLVVAGAGTGKTRTLIYRLARLVESGVKPSEILLLTFTRRAAQEMLNRASSILDERCKQVKGGTFHYYCSQILHRHAEVIGYPNNFTIIDASDALDVIQYVRSQMSIEKDKKRFPNKQTLRSIISTVKNKHLDIRVVIQDQYPQFINEVENIEKLGIAYEDYKAKNYVMDFDDLLIKTKQLLEQNEEVRLKVASGHRHVMVDEFQDTNKLQADLTELFSSVHKNVMVVGDDAQSIYSFRGADHRNILEFPKRHDGCKIIKLEENYRSTQRILNVANVLLDQASYKFDKELFTSKDPGEFPALVKANTENDQSRFITQMVLNLRESGYELNEMAVLFRNGRDSFDLEIELNRKNIPFVKYGGQKFTEAAHIKDVIAHVRVLVNPMDTLAWNRVLLLMEGIGPKTAEDLFEWIRLSKTPYKFNASEHVNERYKKQLDALSKLLQKLTNREFSVSEIIEMLVDYYKSFCEKRYDDYPKRLKDLEAFVGVAAKYSTMSQLLEDLSLNPIEATIIDVEQRLKDEVPLVLSTIHSAKGLEWKHVFIIQALDGVIPSSFSVEDEMLLDEELRLMYVATTRAQEQIYYSYPIVAQSSYGDYFTKLSRFLEPLGEQFIEPWLLEESSEPNQLESGEQPYLES